MRIGRIALLVGIILLLLPETTLAQRTAVSIQSRQGTVSFLDFPAPFNADPQADEIEPNNSQEEVQIIGEASPAVINGMSEVSDVGDLLITFTDNSQDDLEDLFGITTTEAGLNLVLEGFDPADCDLWLIGPDEAGGLEVIDASLNDSPEVLDLPELPAGTYLIAVSIYDPAPGAETTPYTLTITGALATAVEQLDGDVPSRFVLGQNYPNPFNPTTRIQYDVPANAPVRLEVFDLLGRPVRTLVNTTQAAGVYAVSWDGTTDAGAPVATGVYLYRLQAGSFSQSRTMVLLQ